MAVPHVLPEWLADLVLFLVAGAFAAAAVYDGAEHGVDTTVLLLDAVLGGLSCLGIWVRRSRPVAFAAVAGLCSVVSESAGPVSLIALFTVASYRRPAVTAAVVAGYALVSPLTLLIRPDTVHLGVAQITLGLVCLIAALTWGLYIRARRELVASLDDRARRAEAEQELRVAQARHLERTAIAREMHDVLAHRISLLSLQAGALELRPGAAPEAVAAAAGTIRRSAHQALEDLREVIGVLREDRPDLPPERPQPGYFDLARLVDEVRGAGEPVSLSEEVTEPATIPDSVGRAAYRIVQEGLTNARKHARGKPVVVMVWGAPGDGLTIELTNPMLHTSVVPLIPGGGTGLIGLSERVAIVGGHLHHGPEGEAFRVRANLPWPTR
ncbi:sensor histidine kinase [Actinoplanes sp. L3-i22]|uniref:sensor histidine kinase n=1 Tax=Actinoplanes sp. L3-i22 TaxID=2836373 RepID=UPI001C843922|nr:histidine kinase [Actinoplanes sp. L3-i22]